MKRPKTQRVPVPVRCVTCGKVIVKFGPDWATSSGNNYCRECGKKL